MLFLKVQVDDVFGDCPPMNFTDPLYVLVDEFCVVCIIPESIVLCCGNIYLSDSIVQDN